MIKDLNKSELVADDSETDICATSGELITALERLQHYEDLEEAGRLIELPCAVGDTVYSFSFNIVYPFTVNGFEINKYEVEFKGSYCGEEKSLEYWSIHFPVSKIGKTVFLTREEAEAALKGAENEYIRRKMSVLQISTAHNGRKPGRGR